MEQQPGFDFGDPLNRDPSSPNFFESLVFERSKRERETIAGFANASYRWNDLELSGGFRVDRWESKRKNLDSGVSGKQRDTEYLLRGSLAYFFDDDRSMVYALYSEGFEPGDFNLTNFEGQPRRVMGWVEYRF